MTPGERALRDDVAVAGRLPRAVFSVRGERPLRYLHDVLAQDVEGLTPGRGAVAAALTALGRVAAEVRVLPLGDAVFLDAEEAARPGVIAAVARHAPLAGVEVTDVSSLFAFSALRGPRTDEALTAAGLPVPHPEDASFARAGELLVVRVAWGGPGADLIGPPGEVDAALARLNATPATPDELEAARIAAGRPRFGIDLDEELLVNETPLLAHGVSLTKGCYPGQESVARIHNLGHARKALRSLRSAGPLAGGTDVCVDGSVVGRVTSAVLLAAGGSVAIAILRDEVAPGATVRAGDSEALVGDLP